MASDNLALVLEDSENNVRLFREFLEPRGYEMVHCPTLDSAKSFLSAPERTTAPVARIISDLDLKGTSGAWARFDGYRFMRWLYQNKQTGAVAVPGDVTLASTMFNPDASPLYRPVIGYIADRVAAFGFQVLPKDSFLKNQEGVGHHAVYP